ncbi:hypothetical protein [Sandarakinorhabdus limnophila]|uniref:hypothetical protein n=1 Tax=Sandarakinorhabdus limnophila TaxID=210512 RepID=UPI0026EDEDA5|nr:hypothetical protein [Sandarakinorhabdus limnophila]
MKQALIALALLAAPAAAADDPHKLALAAVYKAAFLCSGRWNAGQDVASITRDDLAVPYPEYQAAVTALPTTIDEAARTVLVKFANNMPPRIAVWRPLLGCAQLPPGAGRRAPGRRPHPRCPSWCRA